jgi:hypothetical protein
MAGMPGINMVYGDTVFRVEVDILAQDTKKAVIHAHNASDNITAGMKYLKP